MRKPVRPARSLKNHHIAVVLVAVVVVACTLAVFTWADKGVTVVVDGRVAYHKTDAETVADVLQEVDIDLREGDLVSPLPEQPIADGTEIVVRQAVPVTVECNGTPVEVNVIGSTVADALVAVGIDPSVGIAVEPSMDTDLSEEMTITATDVFLRVLKEDAVVAFETLEEPDPTLLVGERVVSREGAEGRAIRVYQLVMQGDIETTRTVKAEEILIEPTPEVVRVGTKPRPAPAVPTVPGAPSALLVAASGRVPAGANAGLEPPTAGQTMQVTATAYTPWDAGCGGLAVIENRLARYDVPTGWGVVAVDPSVIPLGSRLYVPGYGYAYAADTGGAIKGAKIDVCYWSGGTAAAHTAAMGWGRRSVAVTILGD
ncbi:MAG: 3D domain-containing protein [Coriobacteriia bacterium]|nr:3D domain-containing protein [Coriobacteriia bacterium]